MKKNKKSESPASRFASLLGASRVVSIPGLPSGGPLDLLQLREDVARRLRSAGGRPTDPAWDVQRLIPFRGEDWELLVRLADQVSTAERRVSAGQLASMLIDRILAAMARPKRDRTKGV